MAPKKSSSAYYDDDDFDDGYSEDEEEWWDEDGDDEPVVQPQPKKPITLHSQQQQKPKSKPAPPSKPQSKAKLINEQPHPLAPSIQGSSSTIKPFTFDTPSPDDTVLAARQQSRIPFAPASSSSSSSIPSSSASAVSMLGASSKPTISTPSATTTHITDGIKNINIHHQEDHHIKPKPKKPLSEYIPDPDLASACAIASDKDHDPDTKAPLHLIVVGHVDAGKSTLMGRLLYEVGLIEDRAVHKAKKEAAEAGKGSFAWAWMLDERPEERARGVTVDVAVSRFETEHRAVTLLDAPGHRDFVPNMISGAAQADAALIVVDGSPGGFEAGFALARPESPAAGGQTREHAQLVRSLGIEQAIVVVTKLDSCGFSKERFDGIREVLEPFLLKCGFKKESLQWLPAVGPTGENLVKPPADHRLASWYKNDVDATTDAASHRQCPTLIEAIDRFVPTHRLIEKPLRMQVVEVVAKGSKGLVMVGGKLEGGAVKINDKVLLMPSGEVAVVKSIEKETGKTNHHHHTSAIIGSHRGGQHTISLARAGDAVDVILSGIDHSNIRVGDVICHPDFPIPLSDHFEVRIIVLDVAIPLLKGQAVTLHAHAVRDSGHVSRLVSILDAKSGDVLKERPRCLIKGQTAVIEIRSSRMIPLELFGDYKALGRITLRDGGRTLAVGIVTRLLES